jgi:uncharacterized membrane protein
MKLDIFQPRRAHPERVSAFSETLYALRLFIAVAGLVVATSISLRLAIGTELLDASWALPVRRIAGLTTSTALIVFGNFLPKLPSPWHHAEEPFDWQGVHRFAGMVFMLAGSVSLVGWVLMPVADARVQSSVTMLVAAVLVVGRKWYSLYTWPDKRRSVSS